MNKLEMIERIASETQTSKAGVERILNCFIENTIQTISNGGEVQLIGFGCFKRGDRVARKGRVPSTGKEIIIPASKTPKFIPGKAFKASVNK